MPASSNAQPEEQDNTVQRFYLAQDNDSHWYVVPVDRQKEWDEWCQIDPDDERAWEAPDFVQRVGGSYSLVTFENPIFS